MTYLVWGYVVGEQGDRARSLLTRSSRWRRASRSCATGSTRSTSSSTGRWSTECSRRGSAGSTQRCRWASGVAIGAGSTLPTAAATLAVALLFRPLRAKLQAAVDKRFDRARYEGLRKVEHFLGELRAGRAAPEETGRVLADALGDPRLEVLFWLPAEEIHVDATGRAVRRPSAAPGRMRTPVRRGHLQLATLVHDEALGRRPNLLESVIAASGLAIEISRLRAEVRRRLAEVEDSRARIVTAGDAERRRLERDLHDGAQQRLVAIGLALRHVQGLLRPGGEAATEVDATVTELTDAIEELRELARGVRPAGLDDGLATALQELATRSPVRTAVEATDERFEDRVETAAYFVASEAFANVIKHARATSIEATGATATSSSRCATTASAVPPLPTDRASSAWGTEWRRWAGGCASTARLTQAQSSPRSSRAGSDRRGPGAAEGGPEAALRGRRP